MLLAAQIVKPLRRWHLYVQNGGWGGFRKENTPDSSIRSYIVFVRMAALKINGLFCNKENP
jgi:hypothetical protein